jgi:protein-tyrosine phosphatase
MPERIRMFLDFTDRVAEREVKDPYYGHAAGFEHTLDIIETGVEDLLSFLQRTY